MAIDTLEEEHPSQTNDWDYIDWMRSCWCITLIANPAISVPAEFTQAGLPVGLQIVGRHHDEWSVLQIAHAFEQATRHTARRPLLVSAVAPPA
jgi:amidase